MEIDAIKDYKKFNAFIQTDLGKEFLKLKKRREKNTGGVEDNG